MQLLPLFVELFFFSASKRRWKFGREWFWRIRTVGRGGDTLRFSTNKPASVALCICASVPQWHCTVPPVSLAIVLWVASGHMVGTVPHYHLLLQLYLVEVFCIQSQFLLSSRSILNPLRASWSTGGALEQCGALGAVCVVIESEFLLLKAGQTRFVLPFQPAPYQTVFVIVFVCYWTDTVCPPGPFLVTTLVNSIFSSSFIIESRKPNVCPPHLFLHTN